MSKKLLICKNRVKAYLQKFKMRVSEDFCDELNEAFEAILAKAAQRAKKNKRSTTMACDI
jgi:histone H3/H4